MSLDPTSGESKQPDPVVPKISHSRHPMTSVFLGPEGLRVGWRLVLAVSLCFVISSILSFFLVSIPSLRMVVRSVAPGGPIVLTPALVLLGEGISACAALITGSVMARIENRSFAEYGLPWKSAFGARFWQGAIYGIAMVSMMMGLIAALHGFLVHGLDLHGSAVLRYGLLYLLGFIAVAMFEEFAFRGYLQSTLQLATGFWPAAIILAIIFGSIHLSNRGESLFGAAMAGCFGVVAALTLRRTGNIWFAIGLHSAWDWGETFVYSVRDSGAPATGHLLNTDFHGPIWLTGGTVGPEASVAMFVVLLVSALGIHFLFPARQQAK